MTDTDTGIETADWTEMGTDVRVSDKVQLAMDGASRIKEHGCADRDHYDIVPIVEFWKDGELVVTMFPPSIDRDKALACAIIGGPIRADLIIATLDAHVTRQMTNPATGEQWKQGEMQAACDTDAACSTGLLTDCLVSMAVFKDGHHEMLQRRYTGHETKGNLTWAEHSEHFVQGSGNGTTDGLVIDRLRFAMDRAWSRDAAAEAALNAEADRAGIPPEERYWHEVIAAVRMCLLSGAAGAAYVNATGAGATLVPQFLNEDAINAEREGPLGMLAMLMAARLGILD